MAAVAEAAVMLAAVMLAAVMLLAIVNHEDVMLTAVMLAAVMLLAFVNHEDVMLTAVMLAAVVNHEAALYDSFSPGGCSSFISSRLTSPNCFFVSLLLYFSNSCSNSCNKTTTRPVQELHQVH